MSDPVLVQETMVMRIMKRLGDENFQFIFKLFVLRGILQSYFKDNNK